MTLLNSLLRFIRLAHGEGETGRVGDSRLFTVHLGRRSAQKRKKPEQEKGVRGESGLEEGAVVPFRGPRRTRKELGERYKKSQRQSGMRQEEEAAGRETLLQA